MKRFYILALSILPVAALGQTEPKQDMTQFGIEDLMKFEVTTASKGAQSLSDVPSAIFVISEDDIRRSGAGNIPEALRLAPGVNVSQIDANKWMVSIRGFNNRFADKLLVLIDGQSVYTPLFSGVYWDAHMLPLNEVDRIEVIRGPGGSLWGANAVNGVINIITKKTSQTVGGAFTSEVGSDTKENVGMRYGGKFSKDAFYRVYANIFASSALDILPGKPGPDDWQSIQTGIRIDKGLDTDHHFMFKTDVQTEHVGQRYTRPTLQAPYSQTLEARYPVSGINSILRWEGTEGGRTHSLQISFTHADRDAAPDLPELRDTIDVDYQTQLKKVGRHALTVGAGYSYSADSTAVGVVNFAPSSYKETLFSAFLRDTVEVARDIKLQIGSKLEHNPFTGWEIQPSAQLLYTPNEQRSYWCSLSRAVRTPSRGDISSEFDAAVIPGNPPTILEFIGNPALASEEVISNEIGTRFTLKDTTFLDFTAFFNEYKKLRSYEPGQPFFDTDHVVVPFFFGNKRSAQTAGFEVALKTRLKPWWSLDASASLFSERMRLSSDSGDNIGLYTSDGRGGASRQQYQVHSKMDLAHGIEFDNSLYYVSALINGVVPAYYKLDSRIGWSPNSNLEFSVGVRNALKPSTLQAGEAAFETAETIPRSIYLKMTLKF